MNLTRPLKSKFDENINVLGVCHYSFQKQVSEDVNLQLILESQYKLFRALLGMSRGLRNDVLFSL